MMIRYTRYTVTGTYMSLENKSHAESFPIGALHIFSMYSWMILDGHIIIGDIVTT